ncbi:MAG: thioredoxin family protein [Holosporales bacterium]|jgi:thiol-disulfide isomerase/thioredoxin|nr:thioredoxin family protein [Holosporales bacterium]
MICFKYIKLFIGFACFVNVFTVNGNARQMIYQAQPGKARTEAPNELPILNLFGTKIYKKINGRLAQISIPSSSLQNTIVIFGAVWCPHCKKLKETLSGNSVDLIRKNNINIIIINVPKGVIQKKDLYQLSSQDYEESEQEAKSLNLDSKAFICLGDKATLLKAGIKGLPTVFVVKNGEIKYRVEGEDAISKLNFVDPTAQEKLLELFKPEQIIAKVKPLRQQSVSKPAKTKLLKKSMKYKSLKGLRKRKCKLVVDRNKANKATNRLNNEHFSNKCICHWSN